MNHGPAFQALWAQLRREVRELQAKGYYGDGALRFYLLPVLPLTHVAGTLIKCYTGYWSAGTRLADSARVGPQDLQDGELPEYMVRLSLRFPRCHTRFLLTISILEPYSQCGGAQTRARPSRRTRRPASSTTSGRQTKRRRKAGARVTGKNAFAGAGEGAKLADVEKGAQGAGFGKRAQR